MQYICNSVVIFMFLLFNNLIEKHSKEFSSEKEVVGS